MFELGCIALLLLCNTACKDSDTEVDYKAESMKIYRLLIRQYYSDDEEESVLINQFTITIRPPFLEQLPYDIPGIDRETVRDFIEKNRDASEIASAFPSHGGYQFFSFPHDKDPKEHDRKLKNVEKRLKKLYPYPGKKIISFSKVGFNKKVNQAIVRYSMHGSSMSLFPNATDTSDKDFVGFSWTVFLEKKMGPSPHVWTIKNPDLDRQ